MKTYDTDMRKDGENYRAIGAKSEKSDEAYLYFAQHLDDRLEAQKSHDSALDYLLDQGEDVIVRRATLEYDQEDDVGLQ